jgi:PAS domain S-box-containing protein
MSEKETTLREQIIGLGRSSYKKSYFPALQEKISELNIFKIAFDKLHEAVCFANYENGSISYCNDSLEELIGENKKDIVGYKFQDLVNDRFWTDLKEYADAGEILHYELNRENDTKYLEINTNIIVENSSIIIVAIIKDNTKAKQSKEDLEEKNFEIEIQNKAYEEVNLLIQKKSDRIQEINAQLKKNEDFLESVVRASPIMLGVVVDRVITFVSYQFCKQLGYEKEEILGNGSLFLYENEEEFSRVGEEKYAKIAKYGVGAVESRWKRKDGSYIDVIISSCPIDPTDHSNGVTFVALDISDRVVAENKVKESRERLRLVIEATNDGLWDVNVQENRFYFSPRWYEMLGYGSDEFVSSKETLFGLIHGKDKERMSEHVREFFSGVIEKLHIEYRMLCKNGEYKWIESRGKMVESDAEGNAVRLVGTHTDITDRKLLFLKIKENEAALKEAQAIAKTGSWSYDFIENTANFSDGMKIIFGMELDDPPLLTDELMKMIHVDDRGIVQWNFQKQLEGRNYFICDYRIESKNGELKYVEMKGNAQRDRDGRIISNSGTVTDISQRRKNEIEIERNLNLINLLYENTIDFLEVSSEAEIFENMSKTIHFLSGDSLVLTLSYDEADEAVVLETMEGKIVNMLPKIIEKKLENVRFPSNKTNYPEIWDKILEPELFKVDSGLEYASHIGISGKAIKALKKIFGLGDLYCKGIQRDGKLLGCVVIILHDGQELEFKQMIETITNQSASVLQKLNAEKQLSESELKFRNIFENAPIGIFRAGPGTELLEANSELSKILGVSSPEMLLNNENTLSNILLDKMDKIGDDTNLLSFEEAFWIQEKTEVIIDVTCKIIRTNDNSISYMEGMVEDVSERKRNELVIKETNKNLEEMVYIASHDLQVPLVSMEGYAHELLQNYAKMLDDEGVYCLTRLKTNAVRMHNLVLSLLDISRLNTKKYPYSKFETNKVVEKIVKDLSLAIEEFKVKINIGKLPAILADKLRIEIVFRNIISNSINYGARHIDISYQDRVISIQDDGIGIPKAQLKKIFKPGERIKEIKVEGVGMGLTFSKKVITQHSGRIWAESKGRNKGTTLNIEFNPSNIME